MLSKSNSAYLAHQQNKQPIYTFRLKTLTLACLIACAALPIQPVDAAKNLIKTVPKKTYNIAAGNLSEALPAYAQRLACYWVLSLR